jgi:RNase P/RNase MRP subunit POP5
VRAAWGSIWRYFGMKEANKVGLWLISLDLKEKMGILRCSHSTKEIVISALSLITQINGQDVIISPVKTSGTIKALKRSWKDQEVEIK